MSRAIEDQSKSICFCTALGGFFIFKNNRWLPLEQFIFVINQTFRGKCIFKAEKMSNFYSDNEA